MSSLRRLVAFACAALLAGGVATSEAQAGQGIGGFFFSLPFLQPFYQSSPRYERRQSSQRKRVPTVQRHLTRIPKERENALAVPTGPGVSQPSISCEKAQAIVADYGFKDIKAEICAGKSLSFSATRDGKPFAIEIIAANGELAKVQRVH